ncbi:peptidase [Seiridium cupressi]
MRFACIAIALLGVLNSPITAAAGSDGPSVAAKAAPGEDSIVTGAYIVEFENDGDDVDVFYQGLITDGIEVDHRMDLRYNLFRGVSFHLKDVQNLNETAEAIAGHQKVKNIWPVRRLSFPKLDPLSVGNNATALAALARRQQDPEDTFSPHVMTQVNRLHDEGITGEGIRIGLIDTGVDYLHPALGGCFGEGCLVAYGYDLNGDNSTSPVPIPDDDPYDDCLGHGTHVAGIIAAQSNEQGFLGAAPNVTLGMYKATGCGGDTTNDMLIAGFNMAYEAGSDIISCSAGDDSGWSSDPWAIAASRIAEAGVPVIVALGNSGDSGLWQAASPASGVKVTGVGNVENTLSPTIESAASFAVDQELPEKFGIRWGSTSFQENLTLPLWSVSSVIGAAACSALPDDTPDLAGKVVLVGTSLQDGCNPDDQAGNIVAKGGQYIIYYSLVNGTTDQLYIYTTGVKGTASISLDRGIEFLDLLNGGRNITLEITDASHAGLYVQNWENTEAGGYTSKSSSWGPTYEVEIKPQMTAPGGMILSTYPLSLGGYAVLSGTSMATPLVAAIFALVGQVRGTFDPAVLGSVLSATAKPLNWHDGTSSFDILASVAQQGGGMVQAYDAAHTTTVLSANSLALNDSDHFAGEQTFTIQNLGSEDATYEFGHVKAATMYSLSQGVGTLDNIAFPGGIVDGWATLGFDANSVTVPAGGKAEVRLTVTPPGGLNATLLPVYSGYVSLNSTTGENLSLPYLGVHGSMHDTPVIQKGGDTRSGVYLTDTDGHFNIPAAANRTFTIPRPDSNATLPNAIYPTLRAGLTLGTQDLRADIVPLFDTTLPTSDVFGYQSIGPLPGFPLGWIYRDGASQYFWGQTADGTIAPAGSYKFVVSALRVFGDLNNELDWISVETVPFIIEYAE